MLTPLNMQPDRYDGYAHAQRLGIEVAFLPLDSSTVIWIAEERAIVVNVVLPERRRHEALVHGIGHSIVERTAAVRRARAGTLPWRVVEDTVNRISARQLIHLDDLRLALAADTDAGVVADLLGVGIGMLALRFQELRRSDMRSVGVDAIDRLSWPETSAAERIRCHCLAPAMPAARRWVIADALVGMLNLVQISRNSS